MSLQKNPFRNEPLETEPCVNLCCGAWGGECRRPLAAAVASHRWVCGTMSADSEGQHEDRPRKAPFQVLVVASGALGIKFSESANGGACKPLYV